MFKRFTFNAALLALALAPAIARAQTTPTPAPKQQQTQSTQPPAAASTTATTAQTPNPTPPPPPTKLVRTADGHEYAPVIEATLNYKDWTFKSLKDGTPVNLRKWSQGKKLVLVVYYAPWCGNWKNEAPVVARLYDKYKQHGFDVIAVNEYGPLDAARTFFTEAGAPTYSVVVESEAREAREQTSHYGYRQACGDPRRWGSPFNVFLEPARLTKSGDVLTEKAWIVGGELIEKDAEGFIRQRLGLGEKAEALIEPCPIKP